MKKYIAAILIPCLLLQFTGCYSSNCITKDKFLIDEKGDIEITTYNDQVYKLEEKYYTVKNDTVFIIKSPFYINPYKVSSIPLSDVIQYEVKEFNTTNTVILATISILVIVGLYSLRDFEMGPMQEGGW